jgi:hypothetical protein
MRGLVTAGKLLYIPDALATAKDPSANNGSSFDSISKVHAASGES